LHCCHLLHLSRNQDCAKHFRNGADLHGGEVFLSLIFCLPTEIYLNCPYLIEVISYSTYQYDKKIKLLSV
jgi:hypothetical protein